MKNHPTFLLAAIALAALAGCSSLPPEQSPLELARIDYQAARDNPQTVRLAASELQDADVAMQRANQAYAQNESAATVDHLAYLARQRVAIAEEAAKQKAAEQRVTDANAVRDRMGLAVSPRGDAIRAHAHAQQGRAHRVGSPVRELLVVAVAPGAVRESLDHHVALRILLEEIRELLHVAHPAGLQLRLVGVEQDIAQRDDHSAVGLFRFHFLELRFELK